MSRAPKRLIAAFGVAALTAPAFAQSFNIDIGIDNAAPASTYGAAAGQTGTWNVFDCTTTLTGMVDTAGSVTTVSMSKTGGSNNYFWDHTGTIGDHDLLMDDLQDLGNLTVNKTTYTITGLSAGTYDVYFYCWTPYAETDQTNARIKGSAIGNQLCGAKWTSTHVYGGTYVVDSISLTAGSIMELRVVPASGWGSFNGIQIVDTASCNSGATSYCTPGTSASGCLATLSAVGVSSATAPSGFVISSANTEGNKTGLFYWGAAVKNPAVTVGNSSSFQCVNPPVKRSGLLTGGGSNGACDGAFSVDLNARWTAQPAQNPGPGATLYGQIWYRDPVSTSNQTTSRTDALTWSVCP